MTDYYQVLGLSRTASNSEITKAYRKLAKEWHPDKHQGAKKQLADKKFKEVSEAYGVLSDKDKKEVYDRFGIEGLKQHEQMSGGPAGRGPMGPMGSFFSPFQDAMVPNTEHVEEVEFEALYTGKLMTFRVPIKHKCHKCDATGCGVAAQLKSCPRCNGAGKITQRLQAPGMPMVMQQVTTCPQCRGKGKSFDPKYTCQPCNGQGRVSVSTQMDYMIQPGMDYGPRVLRGKGDYLDDGRRGNLVLKLVPPKDVPQKYQRRGPHLIQEITISLVEALYGFDFRIPYPDPEAPSIRLSCQKPVAPNTVKVMKGKGMPLPDNPRAPPNAPKAGDLILVFKVEFPETLKPEAVKNRQIISQALSGKKPVDRPSVSTSDQKKPFNDNVTVDDLPSLDSDEEDPQPDFVEINGDEGGGPPQCVHQ